MIFLAHVALSRTLAGLLLRNKRLRNKDTNTVVLRGLSGKMTVNSLLIGALATLLVFAIGMTNVAFSEKLFEDHTVAKDCPYDVMAMIDPTEENAFTMEEGETIITKYSPIASKIDYQLYTTDETTLCSSVSGYDLMDWTDKFIPLSQLNQLLTSCGYEPVQLNSGYLVFSTVHSMCETDFSDKKVTLKGKTYSWAGTTSSFPEFARRAWRYFAVPDMEKDDILRQFQPSGLVPCSTITTKQHDIIRILLRRLLQKDIYAQRIAIRHGQKISITQISSYRQE